MKINHFQSFYSTCIKLANQLDTLPSSTKLGISLFVTLILTMIANNYTDGIQKEAFELNIIAILIACTAGLINIFISTSKAADSEVQQIYSSKCFFFIRWIVWLSLINLTVILIFPSIYQWVSTNTTSALKIGAVGISLCASYMISKKHKKPETQPSVTTTKIPDTELIKQDVLCVNSGTVSHEEKKRFYTYEASKVLMYALVTPNSHQDCMLIIHEHRKAQLYHPEPTTPDSNYLLWKMHLMTIGCTAERLLFKTSSVQSVPDFHEFRAAAKAYLSIDPDNLYLLDDSVDSKKHLNAKIDSLLRSTMKNNEKFLKSNNDHFKLVLKRLINSKKLPLSELTSLLHPVKFKGLKPIELPLGNIYLIKTTGKKEA